MRVKYKQWAVDYLSESKTYQFDLLEDDNEKLSSFIMGKDVYLEIGPGKGDFIIGLAAKNPDINYIVIELNKTVAGICLKKIDESKLTNIRLVAGDFYRFVDKIKNNSIAGIYLNFSDPWPKKKHENRRLTSSKFLYSYAAILKEKGLIYQNTDNLNFFNYSLKMYGDYGWDILSIDSEYNVLVDNDCETEFERKFKAAGIKINRVVVQKTLKTKIKEEE